MYCETLCPAVVGLPCRRAHYLRGADEGLGNLVTGDALLTYGDEFVISGGCALLQLDDRRQSPPVPLPATSWRFHSSSAMNPTRYQPCTQSLTYANLAWTRLVDEPYLRSASGGQRPIARHRPSARSRPVQPSPIRACATCGAIKAQVRRPSLRARCHQIDP